MHKHSFVDIANNYAVLQAHTLAANAGGPHIYSILITADCKWISEGKHADCRSSNNKNIKT